MFGIGNSNPNKISSIDRLKNLASGSVKALKDQLRDSIPGVAAIRSFKENSKKINNKLHLFDEKTDENTVNRYEYKKAKKAINKAFKRRNPLSWLWGVFTSLFTGVEREEKRLKAINDYGSYASQYNSGRFMNTAMDDCINILIRHVKSKKSWIFGYKIKKLKQSQELKAMIDTTKAWVNKAEQLKATGNFTDKDQYYLDLATKRIVNGNLPGFITGRSGGVGADSLGAYMQKVTNLAYSHNIIQTPLTAQQQMHTAV